MVLPSIRPAVQDLDYRPGQLAIGRRQVRALWSEISLGAIHSLTGGLGADVTIDAVGVPATFELDGQAKLGRCEQAMKRRSAHKDTRSSGQVIAVEGRDPDDIVVMITYPGPDQAPLHELPARIYGW